MRNMRTWLTGICAVSTLALAGCMPKVETVNAVVLYTYPNSTILKYEDGSDKEEGLYFLCQQNQLRFVRTNRAFEPNIRQTIIFPPDQVSCGNKKPTTEARPELN